MLKVLQKKLDLWTIVTIVIIALLFILLLLPIMQILILGFMDADTGAFTLANFQKVLTKNYYINGLKNTLFVGILGTLGAGLIGIPLAFFTARFKIRG